MVMVYLTVDSSKSHMTRGHISSVTRGHTLKFLNKFHAQKKQNIKGKKSLSLGTVGISSIHHINYRDLECLTLVS